MHLQVEAHSEAIKLFSAYAKDGQSPQIPSFAEAMLPRLERHKTEADSINNALGKLKPR